MSRKILSGNYRHGDNLECNHRSLFVVFIVLEIDKNRVHFL